MSNTATKTDISIVHVGEGMTLAYPNDWYPFVVVRRSPSGKTAYVKPLKAVSKNTGHKPAYFKGPFPVWSHDYTEQELKDLVIESAPERTVRFTQGGYWSSHGATFHAGGAAYRHDSSL